MNTYQSVDLTIQQVATEKEAASSSSSRLPLSEVVEADKSDGSTSQHDNKFGLCPRLVFHGFPTTEGEGTRATTSEGTGEPGHGQREALEWAKDIWQLVPTAPPLVASAAKSSTQASVAHGDGNGRVSLTTANTTIYSRRVKTKTTCCLQAKLGNRSEPGNNLENTPYQTIRVTAAVAAAAANVVANKTKPLPKGAKFTLSHPPKAPETPATKANPNGSHPLATGRTSSLPKSLIRQGGGGERKVNSIFRQTLPPTSILIATTTLVLSILTNCLLISPLLVAQANDLDLIGGVNNNNIDQSTATSSNKTTISQGTLNSSSQVETQSVLSEEKTATTVRDFNFLSNFITSLRSSSTKAPTPVVVTSPAPSYQVASNENDQIITTTATSSELTTTTTTAATTSEDNERPSAEDDDDDAEGCQGLSAHESAKGKNLSDAERLVNLQSCIRGKVRSRLLGATRSGLEIFEKLSLSGGCAASLMGLMGSLADIKSFAFKFLDASAKVPSGVMYGLLSDFGDFDQCLSARSNPSVPFELEAEEGAYSGKYCLMSAKLNYHITLEPNKSVPDGIMADGVLWDDLVRKYWVSRSPKGFQVGMCFPSRCTNDDLDQLYRHVAESYNVVGEIISCQDGLDLKRQYEPDIVQRTIIIAFFALVIVTLIGSFIDRYHPELVANDPLSSNEDLAADGNVEKKNLSSCCSSTISLAFKVLTCFSLAKNWKTFIRQDHHRHHNNSTILNSQQQQQQQQQQQLLTSGTSLSYESDVSKLNKTVSEGIGGSTLDAVVGMTNDDLSPRESESGGFDGLAIANANSNKLCQLLTVKIQPDGDCSRDHQQEQGFSLSHLAGLRLLVVFWITIGHSFLYPSASNYQHYRSIINMNITRDSVWFATTNFTLGIDTLLYITGLLFVYKLSQSGSKLNHQRQRNPEASIRTSGSGSGATSCMAWEPNGCGILRLILKKILRFWPTYVTVIAFAIVVPLFSDGPMWPEMVSKRLGASCRQNWWSNLLFINNFLTESEICLPSSWFVSVLMQLFFIGSVIVVMERRYSLGVAMLALCSVLLISCSYSFLFSYFLQLRAPVIRMDESFVLDVDENIWRLYINIFNNLGPFLVGMAGGYILLKTRAKQQSATPTTIIGHKSPTPNHHGSTKSSSPISNRKHVLQEILLGSLVLIIATLVLSSVFHEEYSRLWSSVYWSSHRIGWAIVTGYIIHNCATGKWKLLNDLLSISTLTPLSKLVFIAYLVYPIYIHVHSGLVRDGLHVSIYNMFNIYTTRLVMTFMTALLIHLLVELPFCSIEEIILNRWVLKIENESRRKDLGSKFHPLLAVAPIVSMQMDNDIKKLQQQQVDNKLFGSNKQINLSEDENYIGANKQSDSAA